MDSVWSVFAVTQLRKIILVGAKYLKRSQVETLGASHHILQMIERRGDDVEVVESVLSDVKVDSARLAQ